MLLNLTLNIMRNSVSRRVVIAGPGFFTGCGEKWGTKGFLGEQMGGFEYGCRKMIKNFRKMAIFFEAV